MRERAVRVVSAPGRLRHPVVDQRVAGPRVEGEHLVAPADPGDVGDAAEIEDRERALQSGGERGVIERHERRALAARGNVGAAEIADDVDPCFRASSEPLPICQVRRSRGRWRIVWP